MSTLLEQALKLSLPERQRLIDDISASIDAEFQTAPLSEEQANEIDRRIADYKAHPERLIPWEEARERLRKIA